MQTKTIALAASLILSLTGASFAQTPAGGGSAEGNLNNPGSVKSNSEKSMERSTGSATMAPPMRLEPLSCPAGVRVLAQVQRPQRAAIAAAAARAAAAWLAKSTSSLATSAPPGSPERDFF